VRGWAVYSAQGGHADCHLPMRRDTDFAVQAGKPMTVQVKSRPFNGAL